MQGLGVAAKEAMAWVWGIADNLLLGEMKSRSPPCLPVRIPGLTVLGKEHTDQAVAGGREAGGRRGAESSPGALNPHRAEESASHPDSAGTPSVTSGQGNGMICFI